MVLASKKKLAQPHMFLHNSYTFHIRLQFDKNKIKYEVYHLCNFVMHKYAWGGFFFFKLILYRFFMQLYFSK